MRGHKCNGQADYGWLRRLDVSSVDWFDYRLNTKARYKRRGALGTFGSFVNQPSWHTELQNSLTCSQCKALTRGAFLGKFLRFHHNGRIC